ncbi:hypothetical protein Taro_029111, partial [Colocasia esculenta]|nr:hypothetical protein [Colocasia esculenta]
VGSVSTSALGLRSSIASPPSQLPEFLKRRNKGKMSKKPGHQLLNWRNRHYKWSYP